MRLVVASVLLALAGLVHAEGQAPDYLEHFVWPGNGGSSADEFFVLYADNCGRPHPDTTRAADVARAGNVVTVNLYLVEPEFPICTAVFRPDDLHPTSIGKLPRGDYTVHRRLHVRPFAGGTHRLELETQQDLHVADAPNAAASGAWYDASQPGTGALLTLLPPTEEVPSRATLFVFTRRTTGEALWLAGAGNFTDAVWTAPLTSPDARDAGATAPAATFTYTGCGTARLRVTGPSLQFPASETVLKQLTATAGVAGCKPPAVRPDGLE